MAILNYQQILELIDKMADKELSVVEIESGGTRLRMERGQGVMQMAPAHTMMMPSPMVAEGGGEVPSAQPSAPAAAPPPAAEEDAEDESWHIITSPIVGTFYRAPNPESDDFTEEGARVSKGSVLCIIEAMKLFNEIESDADGVVARIYPENGQPVEFGEKLFAIRK